MSSKDQIQNTFSIELVYGHGSNLGGGRQCTYNIQAHWWGLG
jgi:hypothetical protein